MATVSHPQKARLPLRDLRLDARSVAHRPAYLHARRARRSRLRVSAAIVTVAVDATTQRLLLDPRRRCSSVASVGARRSAALRRVDQGAARRPRARAAPADARAAAARDALAPRAALPSADAGTRRAPSVAPGPRVGAARSSRVDATIVRDRHRDLYDAEYVKQLDHVNTLRRTIGTRLAVAGDPHPPSEPDPPEEPDA